MEAGEVPTNKASLKEVSTAPEIMEKKLWEEEEKNTCF